MLAVTKDRNKENYGYFDFSAIPALSITTLIQSKGLVRVLDEILAYLKISTFPKFALNLSFNIFSVYENINETSEIVEIQIPNSEVKDALQRFFFKLTSYEWEQLNLSGLKLQSCYFNAIFSSFVKFSFLNHLNLSHNLINKEASQELCGYLKENFKLKNLDLSYCKISVKDLINIIVALESCRSINHINLENISLLSSSKLEPQEKIIANQGDVYRALIYLVNSNPYIQTINISGLLEAVFYDDFNQIMKNKSKVAYTLPSFSDSSFYFQCCYLVLVELKNLELLKFFTHLDLSLNEIQKFEIEKAYQNLLEKTEIGFHVGFLNSLKIAVENVIKRFENKTKISMSDFLVDFHSTLNEVYAKQEKISLSLLEEVIKTTEEHFRNANINDNNVMKSSDIQSLFLKRIQVNAKYFIPLYKSLDKYTKFGLNVIQSLRQQCEHLEMLIKKHEAEESKRNAKAESEIMTLCNFKETTLNKYLSIPQEIQSVIKELLSTRLLGFSELSPSVLSELAHYPFDLTSEIAARQTLALKALELGEVKIFDYLIKKGADVLLLHNKLYKKSLLHYLLNEGNINLKEVGISVDERNRRECYLKLYEYVIDTPLNIMCPFYLDHELPQLNDFLQEIKEIIDKQIKIIVKNHSEGFFKMNYEDEISACIKCYDFIFSIKTLKGSVSYEKIKNREVFNEIDSLRSYCATPTLCCFFTYKVLDEIVEYIDKNAEKVKAIKSINILEKVENYSIFISQTNQANKKKPNPTLIRANPEKQMALKKLLSLYEVFKKEDLEREHNSEVKAFFSLAVACESVHVLKELNQPKLKTFVYSQKKIEFLLKQELPPHVCLLKVQYPLFQKHFKNKKAIAQRFFSEEVKKALKLVKENKIAVMPINLIRTGEIGANQLPKNIDAQKKYNWGLLVFRLNESAAATVTNISIELYMHESHSFETNLEFSFVKSQGKNTLGKMNEDYQCEIFLGKTFPIIQELFNALHSFTSTKQNSFDVNIKITIPPLKQKRFECAQGLILIANAVSAISNKPFVTDDDANKIILDLHNFYTISCQTGDFQDGHEDEQTQVSEEQSHSSEIAVSINLAGFFAKASESKPEDLHYRSIEMNVFNA